MEEKEEKLNDIKLKISQATYSVGDAILNSGMKFKRGHDYVISETISITSDGERRTNHDGTYDEIIKSKPAGQIKISDYETRTYIKTTKSKSQLLRRKIIDLVPSDKIDEEIFYNTEMDKIINNIEAVIDFLKDK